MASAIPDKTATAGRSDFTTFVVTSHFSDDNGASGLTFTATQAGGANLPAWLTFTAGSKQFSGSAGTGDVGIVHIVVTATDADGLSVTDTFKITVSKNTPPAYAASQSLSN